MLWLFTSASLTNFTISATTTLDLYPVNVEPGCSVTYVDGPITGSTTAVDIVTYENYAWQFQFQRTSPPYPAPSPNCEINTSDCEVLMSSYHSADLQRLKDTDGLVNLMSGYPREWIVSLLIRFRHLEHVHPVSDLPPLVWYGMLCLCSTFCSIHVSLFLKIPPQILPELDLRVAYIHLTTH
jgi:hypothetical protein